MDGTPVGLRVVGAGVGVRDGLEVVGVWVGLVLIGAAAVVIVTSMIEMGLMMSQNENDEVMIKTSKLPLSYAVQKKRDNTVNNNSSKITI